MSETSKVVEVPERLRKMADLFEERNRAYGNNFVTMGPVLHAMFPEGVRVETPDEWQRIFTIVMAAMKITRYAQNLSRGGHQDSLDDMSVYMQMGAYTDDLARERDAKRIARMAEPDPPAPEFPIRDQTFAAARTLLLADPTLRAARETWPSDANLVSTGNMHAVSERDSLAQDWIIYQSEESKSCIWRGTGDARSDGTA